MIKYSIIIPTLNHLEDCLKPCIESIIANTNMVNVEIIVVANGCTDGTASWVESLKNPLIRVINCVERTGAPHANNLGMKIARGEYIILLNNDTVVLNTPQNLWIEMLEAPFSNEKVGISGPSKIWDANTRYEFVISFCMMIHRKVIDRIGYLDESYTVGDEVDYCVRAKIAGFELAQTREESEVWCYSGSFPLWHKGGTTLPHLPDSSDPNNERLLQTKWRKEVINSVIIYAKDGFSLRKCINSIWKYTTFLQTEILILGNPDDGEIKAYFEALERNGPYILIPVSPDAKYSASVLSAIPRCTGDNVIILHSDAVLSEQSKDEWVNKLSNTLRIGAGSASPSVVNGRPWLFCTMFNRNILINAEDMSDVWHRMDDKGLKAVEMPIAITFPGTNLD